MIMMILMMIIIIVIIIAIMIMMIEIILIIAVVIINSPFQPGDFSTGSTAEYIYSEMLWYDGKEYECREYFKKAIHTDNKTNIKLSVQILTSTHLSVSKEQLLFCSILPMLQSFKTCTIVNISINDNNPFKVGTVMEFDSFS